MPPSLAFDDLPDAQQVAALLAVDPHAFGGVLLKARSFACRQHWLETFVDALPEPKRVRRLAVNTGVAQLVGGLDVSATLQQGKPVTRAGLLACSDGGVLIMPMAERQSTEVIGSINAALDNGCVRVERDGISATTVARFGLVAFDTRSDEDEPIDGGLIDRLAFHVDLDGEALAMSDESFVDNRLTEITLLPARLAEHIDFARVRAVYRNVDVSDDLIEMICAVSVALGVSSVRAPLFCLRAMRAVAAIADRTTATEADARQVIGLCLAWRATQLPSSASEADEAPADISPADADAESIEAENIAQTSVSPTESEPHSPASDVRQGDVATDRNAIDAALAALPAGLLAQLSMQPLNRRHGRALRSGRSGQRRRSTQRGRPNGAVRGDLRHGQRLDVMATLRAAAPWQRLRRAELGLPKSVRKVCIRPDDIHVTRFKQSLRSVTVFVVDASGSAAAQRLAEAKGAVELLLADCYVRRDQVALIAFRGASADVILPPTRSLVRARRRLSQLPGGGGTPLANAIDTTRELAATITRSGDVPIVCFLTDGRANVDRDGIGGRERAQQQALRAAVELATADVRTLVIDIASRPAPLAQQLADSLGAKYVALPHADALAINSAIQPHTRLT